MPGIRISEHLPRIARFMDHMAIIRSMNTKEGDHGQGTYYLHTGYAPRGPIQYPSLGSLVAKEVGTDEAAAAELRQHRPVSLLQPGRLQPRLPGAEVRPAVRRPTTTSSSTASRRRTTTSSSRCRTSPRSATSARTASTPASTCCEDARTDFVAQRPGVATEEPPDRLRAGGEADATAASKAFNLEDEPDKVRDAYGRNIFGQGCLLARRLVEQGVPFVEVTLGGSATTDSAGTRTRTTSSASRP